MPPDLGGCFMVRSDYPPECRADDFDFVRIEALKPAIEAWGCSPLSQAPMLGLHKQVDNRRKRVVEFLPFRVQGGSRSASCTRIAGLREMTARPTSSGAVVVTATWQLEPQYTSTKSAQGAIRKCWRNPKRCRLLLRAARTALTPSRRAGCRPA